MSPNYFCLNNIFLEVILVILISQSAFNQFREPIYNITTNITLPFDVQCSGNGSFMFIVEFRLVEFKDLLLANRNSTTNNIDNCLSFLFCYESESSGEYVKPQFKIVNSNSNKIWNFCMENWLGFYIVFCLHEHETEVPQLTMDTSFSFIEEEKQEMSISMGYFHSTKSYFRIQFEPNNFRFFIKLMMMKEFINGTWFTFGIASEMFLRESLEEVPKPLYYVKIDEQLCEWIQINTEGNVHCSGF